MFVVEVPPFKSFQTIITANMRDAMLENKLKGSCTALVTPFANGSVDFQALEKLVEWQISQGTHSLLAAGSTGEAFSLSHEEQKNVIETCVKISNGRVPIIAGTSAITTQECISLTQQAKQVGADACLIVAPPYIKPNPKAIHQFYVTIADACELPIILYNNPSRSGVTISNETIIALSQHPLIIGLKDATGDLAKPADLGVHLSKNFAQLSGEDITAPAYLAQGGIGCISVTANIAPKLCAEMQNAWFDGEIEKVHKLRDRLTPLHRAVFMAPSPAPCKYALSQLGFIENELRLPLLPADQNVMQHIDSLLKELNL